MQSTKWDPSSWPHRWLWELHELILVNSCSTRCLAQSGRSARRGPLFYNCVLMHFVIYQSKQSPFHFRYWPRPQGIPQGYLRQGGLPTYGGVDSLTKGELATKVFPGRRGPSVRIPDRLPPGACRFLEVCPQRLPRRGDVHLDHPWVGGQACVS